jgi:uncharacterized repeat protein (TIGR01451 family)
MRPAPSRRRIRTRVTAAAAFVLALGILTLPAIPAAAAGAAEDLSVDLTQPTGDATAGLGWTYTMTVANAGPQASTGYTVSLAVPSNTTFSTADPGCSDNATTVDCVSGGLAALGSQSFNVTLLVASDYADNTSLDASASITNFNGDTDLVATNNADNVSTTVQRVADLAIVKSGPDGTSPIVVAGDSDGFDYTLTVSTSGPSDTSFTASDTLPSGATFDSSDAGCTHVGQAVSCDGSIAAGDPPVVITVHVLVDPSVGDGSILDNDATVAATGGTDDNNLTNNSTNPSGTVHTTVTAQADLHLSVAATTGNQIAGDPAGIDYTYTVSNDGPSNNIGGFTISDMLPSGFSFVSSSSCTGVGQSVSCSSPTNFPVSESPRVFTVHAKIASSKAPPGTYSDAAVLTLPPSGTTDPNGVNDTGSAGVIVITRADLRPTLTVDPGNHIAGDPAGFVITLRVDNDGYSDNTGGYVVNVPLPTDFTFASGTGCSVTGTGFKCTNGSGLLAGAHDTYSVTVKIASNVLDSTPTVTGTVTSSGTTDPNGANNSSGDTVSVITRADLAITFDSAVGSVTSNLIFANTAAAQNTVTYQWHVTNAGYSDAQSVVLNSALAAVKIDATNATYCKNIANGVSPCAPTTLSFNGSTASFTLPAQQTATIVIREHADPAQPVGATTVAPGASLSSTTLRMDGSANDGTGSDESAISTSTNIHTRPGPPIHVKAFAGNSSAVVDWDAPTNDGGESVDSYNVIVDCTTTGCLEPGPYTGIVPTQFAVGDDNDVNAVLSNGFPYVFRVQAVNEVGTSDESANSTPTITPSQQESAEIFSATNQSQQTGEGTPSANDKVVVKQLKNLKNGSIGTIDELLSDSNVYSINPALFCGNLPCVNGEVVVTKLTDVATNRYLVDIIVAKGVAVGTGKKLVWFDSNPGDNGPPGPDPTPPVALDACPKTIPTGLDACVAKVVSQPALNPALLVEISVRFGLIDPAAGLRK